MEGQLWWLLIICQQLEMWIPLLSFKTVELLNKVVIKNFLLEMMDYMPAFSIFNATIPNLNTSFFGVLFFLIYVDTEMINLSASSYCISLTLNAYCMFMQNIGINWVGVLHFLPNSILDNCFRQKYSHQCLDKFRKCKK